MKVLVYVEGPSDERALSTLWRCWNAKLRERGHHISVANLESKGKLLRKIGARAAAELLGDPQCLVIGMPDLYPTRGYEGTPYAHHDAGGLCDVQKRAVMDALTAIRTPDEARKVCQRFLPSALKHDLEMLLLAAKDRLGQRLGTRLNPANWRRPVEEQNLQHPPKMIVEGLFRSYKGRSYRDTVDAPEVLRRVATHAEVLLDNGQLQCPVFKAALDWIVDKTGVAYP